MGHNSLTESKPKILAFIRHYLPGYRAGGPIRTLANLTERLGDEFSFFIVTLDHDAGNFTPYNGIVHGHWNEVGKAHVRYLNSAELSAKSLTTITCDLKPEVVYLNGFFDPVLTQRVLWSRRMGRYEPIPVVLAPRGEFSAGALSIKKTKKKVYISFCRRLGLYHDLKWQASSESERSDILRTLEFVQDSDIYVAMNLSPPNPPDALERRPLENGQPLRVCFLSRISPMKNLDFALNILAKVHSNVSLSIYGPKEDLHYWSVCEGLIAALPPNVKVAYGGEIHCNDVRRTLAEHDLFLLPTRGENYGHVIHEALSVGLPVLISDQTPWVEVEKRQVGWTIPLDSCSPFATVIDAIASWTPEEHTAISHRAKLYANETFGCGGVVAMNRTMFTDAIARKI